MLYVNILQIRVVVVVVSTFSGLGDTFISVYHYVDKVQYEMHYVLCKLFMCKLVVYKCYL